MLKGTVLPVLKKKNKNKKQTEMCGKQQKRYTGHYPSQCLLPTGA